MLKVPLTLKHNYLNDWVFHLHLRRCHTDLLLRPGLRPPVRSWEPQGSYPLYTAHSTINEIREVCFSHCFPARDAIIFR